MEKIRYLSLFSGIEAFSCAVRDMPEFEPVAFAEIEPFPCAVLAHHYPNVKNLGDVTKIDGRSLRGSVDLIVGGSPCQGFSVAGQRKGLDDERSCLALTFVRLVDEVRPKMWLWENVPGCTSTNGGQDLRSFFAALDDIGYSFAWTVLDSQYFGVAQRRRRVFAFGVLGTDWERCAKVLLEPESMCGNPPSRRKKGEGDSGRAEGGAGVGGEQRSVITPEADGGCATISAKWSKQAGGFAGDEYHNLVGEPEQNPTFATLCASGAGCDRPSAQGSQLDYCVMDRESYGIPGNVIRPSDTTGGNGKGYDRECSPTLTVQDRHAVAYAVHTAHTGANGIGITEEVAHTLDTAQPEAVAFAQNQRDEVRQMEVSGALSAESGMKQTTYVAQSKRETWQMHGGDAHPADVAPTLDVRCRNGGMQNQASTVIVEQDESAKKKTPRRTG